MQQRRAIRATVRKERDGTAGDEEPATKSRASSIPTIQEEKSGRRCERYKVETSTVDRQQFPGTRETARSRRLLRASARSREATSVQKSQNTEWVGRRPRLRLAGSRAVVGRQAGGGGGTCRKDTRIEIRRVGYVLFSRGRGRSEYYSNA
jgi:hypothetical protein